MDKVLIIHGFEGMPNGGWRPWLMGELEKLDVYACALPMPAADAPVLEEWVEEIDRQIPLGKEDAFYLVGHSLGVPAILRYLERAEPGVNVRGVVLTAGPLDDVGLEPIRGFFLKPFDFETIKLRAERFAVIHGDDDDVVPFAHAERLAKMLDAELLDVPGGGHLTGSAGWRQLPQALEVLKGMFE